MVEAYLNGLLCAADIINKTPAKAVELLTKGTYFKVSPEVLSSAFKSAPAPVSFVPDLPSIQSVVDELGKLGYIKGKISATDIFRLDTIQRLEKVAR